MNRTLHPPIRWGKRHDFFMRVLNLSDAESEFGNSPRPRDFADVNDLVDMDALMEKLRAGLYTPWEPMTIVLTILYLLVFIFGLFGNILVIIVVFRYRHLRTLTNVFLLNLTLGDLMVVCICIPVTYGHYIYKDWIYGNFLCKLANFLPGLSVSISAFSLLSISVNRYYAIHRPMKAKLIFSKWRVYLIIGLIWLASSIVFIPTLVINSVKSHGVPGLLQRRNCVEAWPTMPRDKQIYECSIFVVIFVIPLTVMWITYIRICATLWHRDGKLFRRDSTYHKQQADKVIKQRRKSVKMLVVVLLLFSFSLFPCYVVNLWLNFNTRHEDAPDVMNYVFPFVALLVHANSAMNPVVYCYMSKSFKRAFVMFVLGLKKLRRHRATNNSFIRASFNVSVNDMDNSGETVLM